MGKKRLSQKVFYNSCGTLIWVGIIPVKVDGSLIVIIRTYIIVYILYCSTKPLVFFQSRLNVEVQVNFSHQFYVHVKCNTIYTRFHALMLDSTMAFM